MPKTCYNVHKQGVDMGRAYSEKNRALWWAFRERHGRRPTKAERKALLKGGLDWQSLDIKEKLTPMNIHDSIQSKNNKKTQRIIGV